MKPMDRIALLYAASFLGMGAVGYARGRRGMELFTDATIYGLTAGTAINGAVWLMGPAEEAPRTAGGGYAEHPTGLRELFALANSASMASGNGNLPEKAVKMLSNLDEKSLYRAMKSSGVKIAPVPDNPSIVEQDED